MELAGFDPFIFCPWGNFLPSIGDGNFPVVGTAIDACAAAIFTFF